MLGKINKKFVFIENSRPIFFKTIIEIKDVSKLLNSFSIFIRNGI